MVEQRVMPLLRELTARTGETSHFAVADGSSVTYLAKVDSPHPIRMFSYTGWRGPLHATGVGKALLAHSAKDTIEKVIEAGLPSFTKQTIVDPHALGCDLDQIRDKGFAIDDGELLEGLYCLAVPVLTHDRCVGAVSVSGPRERMMAGAQHLDEVRSTASQIARLF